MKIKGYFKTTTQTVLTEKQKQETFEAIERGGSLSELYD